LALPVTWLLSFVPPRHAVAAAVATACLAFAAVSLMKPSTSALDALLLAASVWLGASTALRQLARVPRARPPAARDGRR